jgi:hypothetical protein
MSTGSDVKGKASVQVLPQSFVGALAEEKQACLEAVM